MSKISVEIMCKCGHAHFMHWAKSEKNNRPCELCGCKMFTEVSRTAIDENGNEVKEVKKGDVVVI